VSKHTKGPWKFDAEAWMIVAPWTSVEPKDSTLMGDYRGAHIADLSESHGSGKGGSRDFAKPEAEANARLIAAAPDLLASLKEAVTTLKEYLEGCDHSVGMCECGVKSVLEHASEVIAKAEQT
jgi:hypothetical protein